MIVLVQINYSADHSEKILPLGILATGSALKKYGFAVELVNITEKEIAKTAEYIIKLQPDYVGLSVMTGRQTRDSVELSQKIKARSSIPILWGGIHPSLMVEQCLSENYIDYVIFGEAEETIVEFSQKMTANQDLSGVLGLGFKQADKAIINPARPQIKDLDQWPLDFSLLDLNKFIYKLDRYDRVIAYKTSRGCPFNCGFCYNKKFNQNKWRAYSIARVVKDIEFFKKNYQVEAIKFYDDNFFVDKKRALEILRQIGIPAHLEIRIDMIDEEVAEKLKTYRVFDLLIGIESGSDRILKLINKNITVEDIIKAVKIIRDQDLVASYSFILGLPTETKAEYEATINLIWEIYKMHKQAAFTIGTYLPYPGSAMYDFAVKNGFQPPSNTVGWGDLDRFRNSFYSPWVNAKSVWRIREYFKLLKFKLGFINKWFEFRIKNRFFGFPLDIYIIEFLSGLAIEEKNWFGKFLRKIYNKIK